MKAEVFRRILKDFDTAQGGVILAEFLASEMAAIESIQRRLRSLSQQEESAFSEHQQRIHRFQEARQLIRAECKHWSSTHHGDPSGGSDKYTSCDICGETL